MTRLFPFLTLLFSILACGGTPVDSDGSSGTGGEGDASGGSSSASGGAPAFDAKPPVPTGPGTDYDSSLGPFCPQYDCVGRPTSGIFKMVERCDQTGSWEDESCPSAAFAWTLIAAQGQIEFGPQTTVNTVVSVSWTTEYPASCGGCDVEEQLATWSELACVPNTDGSCSCTGKSEAVSDFTGSITLMDGSTWIVENQTPEGELAGTEPPRHLFGSCAGADGQLTVYDEFGAHMLFQLDVGI